MNLSFPKIPDASAQQPLPTELLLLQRLCCGNGCRNCPYQDKFGKAHQKSSTRLAPQWRRLILFDFDGTLADSLQLQHHTAHILNERHHLIDLRPGQEAEIWRDLNTLGTLGTLRKYRIPAWRIPFLLREAQQLMADQWGKVTPYPGVLEMLQTLSDQGHTLGIVTANQKSTVQRFLQQHRALHFFADIESVSLLKSKSAAIHSVQKKGQWIGEKVLYVGDELRDVEAAQRAQVACLGVSWGINSAESLLAQQIPVADTSEKLLELVSNWIVYGLHHQ